MKCYYSLLMELIFRYPLYQRGNPQLRSFLTNFNMYPVRPSVKQPSNVVTFHCSMKMTIHDVKNYLTKIYQLPVDHVKMDIELGMFAVLVAAEFKHNRRSCWSANKHIPKFNEIFTQASYLVVSIFFKALT